jgi:hypothetical protein
MTNIRQPPAIRNAGLEAIWRKKSAAAFLIPSIAEVCQYFGLPVLGAAFDVYDLLMYGLGVAFAVFVDLLAFSRMQ